MDDLLQRCRERREGEAQVNEGDVTTFMQNLGGGGHRRPAAWSNVVDQLRDYPTGIRAVVLRRIAAWLPNNIEERAPCLVALGSMLRDINNDGVVRCMGCSDMDREVGCQMADAMIGDLTEALQDGSLHRHELPAMVGPATREAAMDLPVMADRRFETDMIAVDDSWGNAMEQEEVQVGILITRWIRARLARDAAGRMRLHRDIMLALRKQVLEECRHVRRLHMALIQAETMGIERESAAASSHENEIPRDAQDLVDQIVMNIGRDTKKRTKRTVADMLRDEGATSSGSRRPPPAGTHGSLYQECESLRRWLNGVYEGSLSSLAEDAQVYLDENGGLSGRSQSRALEEDDLQEEADTEIEEHEGDEEDEEVTLVQGRTGPTSRGRRERSRSPSEPRRSWRTASAAGWGPMEVQERTAMSIGRGGGRQDLPLRRRLRGREEPQQREGPSEEGSRRVPGGRSSARGAAEASGRGRFRALGHARDLIGAMGPHAWHCLLEMRSVMEPASDWGFGLSPSARANVQTSYEEMTRIERQIMVVEFLRVISAVMADVAQAMTNALPNILEEDTDQHEQEGDETATIQLSAQKAMKLKQASVVRDVSAVLGTDFDKISRSLMASLERMGVEETVCAVPPQ